MVRVMLLSKAVLSAPFQSKEAFFNFVQAASHPENGDGHTSSSSRWTNKDLAPTPPSQRTWTWYNLPFYWFSTMFGTTGWNVPASLIAIGLTWQQAFVSCILGSLISGLMVVGMARPGAKYHIGYPVLARSVMGMWGSYFFVFIRAVVCIIWYGIQTYYGANFLSVCLRCIFGSSWESWPNRIPVASHVTSKQLLAFFLVWMIEFPFMWVHPSKIHYIFTVKGFIMPFATFGLFGWCIAYGGGIASMDASNTTNNVTTTTPLGWLIMSGINVVLGSLSPMLVNQPDLARYAKNPRDAGWPQGACVFLVNILVFFLSLASTTSLQQVWGTAYWNLWDLLDAILDHYWTAGARAGVFFVGASFLLATLATNFGANSLPFGADATGLFPRVLTIRRGQILCAVLGVAVLPWELLASASAFLSFLGSYNIFMAPLCAVVLIDYWYARRGNVHVPSLYQGWTGKGGLYWFGSRAGVNWVGVSAWIGGTIMGLPGLVGQYQPQVVSTAAKEMYMMGWVLAFASAGVIYAIGVTFVKPQVFPDEFEEAEGGSPREYEWLANQGREGFLEGERNGDEVIYSPPSLILGVDDVVETEKGIKTSESA